MRPSYRVEKKYYLKRLNYKAKKWRFLIIPDSKQTRKKVLRSSNKIKRKCYLIKPNYIIVQKKKAV